jgi:putative membrane protein
MVMAEGPTLILCVDRDDDIGFKGGIQSPVLGREDCLSAATTLGLVDPEDSDVNAIFQAVCTYDKLLRKGENVVIAILTGNHLHMIEGDRKIAVELEEVVTKTGAEECVLVTDGAEDEFVLPIIHSHIRVTSIQRVIVKQMPNLEGTYYIIKKLFDDPKISRQVLIPIGLAMLLYAVTFFFGYPQAATITVVGVLGIYLLFKGLGIDEVFGYFIAGLQSSLKGGRFTFVSYITAIILAIIGLISGLNSLLEYYSETGWIPFMLFAFIFGSIWWFIASGLIASIGKLIDMFINEPEHLGRMAVLPFFVLAVGIIAYGGSVFILSTSGISFIYSSDEGMRTILLSTVGGLACALFGVYIQRIIYRLVFSQEGPGEEAAIAQEHT